MTETEILFTHVLDCDRVSLYLNKSKVLAKDKLAAISSVLKRRAQGEPLAYILGKTEFFGLEFKVTTDVLIPRQETEILVETVINIVTTSPRHHVISKILEIGTGSGCIAVSLAKNLENIEITATDISLPALKVAQDNACKHNVSDKINFIQSDLLRFFALRVQNDKKITLRNDGSIKFDFIVSNPPYIVSEEISRLEPEVRREPRIALDGGKDGFDFYRKIIDGAPGHLREGGLLIMELGYNQAEKVKNLIQNTGNFEIIEIVRDYSNIERVIIAKKYG